MTGLRSLNQHLQHQAVPTIDVCAMIPVFETNNFMDEKTKKYKHPRQEQSSLRYF